MSQTIKPSYLDDESKKLIETFEALRKEASKNVNNMTLGEINEEIKATREERKNRLTAF